MSSVLKRGLTVAMTASIVALFTGAAFTQATWGKAAPFPEPEEEVYGVAANGKLYAIGGYGLGNPKGFAYQVRSRRRQMDQKGADAAAGAPRGAGRSRREDLRVRRIRRAAVRPAAGHLGAD